MKKSFLRPFAMTVSAALSMASVQTFAAIPLSELPQESISQSVRIERIQSPQLVIEPAASPQQQYADHASHSSHASHASHCSAYNSCKTP